MDQLQTEPSQPKNVVGGVQAGIQATAVTFPELKIHNQCFLMNNLFAKFSKALWLKMNQTERLC